MVLGENGEQFIEHGRIIKTDARLDSEGNFNRFSKRAKDVIDCDVHETPLTFDDCKGATALRDGGAGAHRGRAHAPAYERPRGSM